MLAEIILAANAVNAAAPAIKSAVNNLGGAVGAAHKYTADTSLIDLAKASRVEPLTIVGSDLLHLDYLPEILQSGASQFAGYYLQALAFTASVGHVKATAILDRLNPNRTPVVSMEAMNGALTDWRVGKEAYKFRLPTSKNKRAIALECARIEDSLNSTVFAVRQDKSKFQISQEDFKVGVEATHSVGDDYLSKGEMRERLEAAERENAEHRAARDQYKNRAANGLNDDVHKDQQQIDKAAKAQWEQDRKHEAAYADDVHKDNENMAAAEKEKYEEAKKKAANGKYGFSLAKDSVEQARELCDLSVGKMVVVSVGGGSDQYGNKIPQVEIPISFRLMVNSVPESTLQGLLSKGLMDYSMVERYHAWRAGRIEFVKDLVFCQDIIDETKKAMMDDKTGVHQEVVARVTNAKKAGLLTKNPSLNVASNLYFISEVSAANIEKALGGKLSSPKVREKIFAAGYAMIICVVDRQWERVTFYHRGISASTNVSLKDIRISNKKTGPDVGDIMKAYMAGNNPSF